MAKVKKQFIFILLLNFVMGQTDSLWTEVSGDTVTIHHDNTERNCGVLFDFSVIFLDSNIIIITEVDTGDVALCDCEFDLELMIGGLSTGVWTAEIYGQDLDNNGETEYFGSVEFTINVQGGTGIDVVNEYQSPCNYSSNDDYSYSITLDNTEYSLGDTMKANLKMTNLSNDTINFVAFGWFDWLLIDSVGIAIDGIAFIPIDNSYTINPGDSLTKLLISVLTTWIWDQQNYGTYHSLMKPFYNYESNDWDTASFKYVENLENDNQTGIHATDFKLNSPYPNPFNPATTIRFNVGDVYMHPLRLDIYNITGQLVETLINKPLIPGEHEIIWNAGNLPSGVYFVRLQSGEFVENQKVILIK